MLETLGLLGIAKAGRDLAWATRFAGANKRYLKSAPQTLPIPPVSLRILVAASPDIAWFVESGRRGADSVVGILQRNGVELDRETPLLDFGCGCGRVVRHFAGRSDAIFGSDVNARLVEWSRECLSFGTFRTNALAPPLSFDAGQFGLVYALSVFTHLPEPLQASWMAELWRVLRPGAYLVFSTHGSRYASTLAPADRQRFLSGDLVTRYDERAGGNVCGAYHPERYVREQLSRGFVVVDFQPEGAAGNPWQDLWLLRKTE